MFKHQSRWNKCGFNEGVCVLMSEMIDLTKIHVNIVVTVSYFPAQ